MNASLVKWLEPVQDRIIRTGLIDSTLLRSKPRRGRDRHEDHNREQGEDTGDGWIMSSNEADTNVPGLVTGFSGRTGLHMTGAACVYRQTGVVRLG